MSGQLAIDGTESQPEPIIRDGLCACGCDEEVGVGMKYKNGAHRQRAYRRRVKAEMERVGLPPLPSLRAAGVSRPTNGRNGDAPVARKGAQRSRSGLQVSYHKAVEHVADSLEVVIGPRATAVRVAEHTLAKALSPRQRARLEQQRPKEAANG